MIDALSRDELRSLAKDKARSEGRPLTHIGQHGTVDEHRAYLSGVPYAQAYPKDPKNQQGAADMKPGLFTFEIPVPLHTDRKPTNEPTNRDTSAGDAGPPPSPTLIAAREYVASGISVIPLYGPDEPVGQPVDKRGKRPAINSWKEYQSRLPTDAELVEWFSDGTCNIGIVTGELSGFTVVDFDTDDAIANAKAMGFPVGPTVRTAKGIHGYCKYEDGHRNFQKRKDLPGVDLRGEGGYVVAPPSIHATGVPYEWIKGQGLEISLASVPEWVLQPPYNGREQVNNTDGKASTGNRNMTLTSEIGRYLRNNPNATLQDTFYFATKWNTDNCEPPLDADEVRRTARSIFETNERNAEQESHASKSFPQVPFPVEVFPLYMRNLASTYSNALQCSPAFMMMNFLTVISGAVGNSITVAIKRGWFTAVFLWFGIIDKTGGGKTHPQSAAMKPLHKLQSIEAVKHENMLAEYKADEAAYKRDKRAGDPPSEPEPMRHYYSQNFTIESLIPMYKRSARGLIIHVDELAGLLKGLGQYKGGKGSDDEQLLSLFNCEALKSDRVSKNGFCRESGAAVLGGIQPEIFASVFGDKEQANGMLYRFLPMVLNSTPPMFTDDELSQADEDAWAKTIDWMYSIPAVVDQQTGCIIKNVLTVTAEGKTAFQAFHDELSAIQPFMPPRFQGYLPKLKTYCLKFMGVLHILECYPAGLGLTVNKTTVEGAIKLTRYFAGEALQLIRGSVAKGNPFHAALHKAIDSLRDEATGGMVLLSRVREKLNELLPPDKHIEDTQNKKISTWLQEIGLTVTTRSDNKSVVIIS